MSSFKLRPERPSRDGKVFSRDKARFLYPTLCRGAVYRYDFHEDLIEPGEPWKIGRPVIIMDQDPLGRIAENKSLHVIPLSLQEKENDDAIHVKLNSRIERAIWSQATTINSRKLGDFEGLISVADLKRLSDRLQENIDPSAEKIQARLRPGSVILIPWHDVNNMRPVMIVSNGHLKGNPTIPVQVSAIDRAILRANGEQPHDSTLAISPERLSKGIVRGVVPLETLRRAQVRTQQNFGIV